MEEKRLRRILMGLRTLLGGPAAGFFSPYRHADQVAPPGPYGALVPIFEAARPAMEEVLDDIDGAAGGLSALAGPPPRPRWDQSWFPRLDGAAALAIVRRARPGRIVEVGSGHSTRMLAHAAPDALIDCIDPAPRADIGGLGVTLHDRVLGPGHFGLFEALGPGDVAFFDSSHILWPGSDVDMILNRIIPALGAGVLVHVHDILLPDPYPPAWEWRGYTEQIGLAPLLLGGVDVVFSSHFALTRMAAAGRPGIAGLPLMEGALETSLWMRRR